MFPLLLICVFIGRMPIGVSRAPIQFPTITNLSGIVSVGASTNGPYYVTVDGIFYESNKVVSAEVQPTWSISGSIENITTNILRISEQGAIYSVSNGRAVLKITESNNTTSVALNCVLTTNDTSILTWRGFEVGSAASNSWWCVTNLIIGKTPSSINLPYFNGFTMPTTWNTNSLFWPITNLESHVFGFWFYNSAIEETNWLAQNCPTLVTRRHAIIVNHMNMLGDGITNSPYTTTNMGIWLLDRNNIFHQRRYIDAFSTNNFTVFQLDRDIPTNIPVMKTITAQNVTNYFPMFLGPGIAGEDRPTMYLPAIQQDHHCAFTASSDWVNFNNLGVVALYPTNSIIEPWLCFPTMMRPGARGGDSGSPVMLILNNEFVFLGQWQSVNGFTQVPQNVGALNAVISLLGTRNGLPDTNSLTLFDLSGFLSY
jgi:hypothetical protein